MKLQYKIGMLAVGALALCSCDRHDIINDIAPVGQEVPACYWQLNSTVCKAGESFGFQGKYSVNPAATPDRSEVWYQIVRTEEASVTSKLGGSSLAYTHKSSKVDTIRSYQSVAVFPHSAAQQNGQEFVINGTVPVSRTLAPVKWADIAQWDQANFDTYYPEGFAEGPAAEPLRQSSRRGRQGAQTAGNHPGNQEEIREERHPERNQLRGRRDPEDTKRPGRRAQGLI